MKRKSKRESKENRGRIEVTSMMCIDAGDNTDDNGDNTCDDDDDDDDYADDAYPDNGDDEDNDDHYDGENDDNDTDGDDGDDDVHNDDDDDDDSRMSSPLQNEDPKLLSVSHPANLQAVGCHRHCRMKIRSCKACHIQLICEQ